jgi:hypothetical protein
MAGIIKTIIEGILEGLEQISNDPQGPPKQRQVPRRAPVKRAPVGKANSSPLTPFQTEIDSSLEQPERGDQAMQQSGKPFDLKQFATDKKQAIADTSARSGVSGPAITARELLKSPRGAREAMIASEILNRPEHRW